MEKKTRQPSVKGLANIGALLGRGELPQPAVVKPKRIQRTGTEIHTRTMEKIAAAIGQQINGAQHDLISHYVRAAVRDSYNTGHCDALEQNSAVEKLLKKQYQARTKTTLPAAAAAIMEQKGLSSLTLDLALVATVFDRCKIDFTVSAEDVIDYTLKPIEE